MRARRIVPVEDFDLLSSWDADELVEVPGCVSIREDPDSVPTFDEVSMAWGCLEGDPVVTDVAPVPSFGELEVVAAVK